MGRGQWVPCGAAGDSDREISNVVITITDNAAVVEGQTVTAMCNGKTFSSMIKNGIAKIYTSEVGTYTITVGSYNTMLVCPYFGQFSTDIYSGVLQVTCAEAGGKNKTCHVQSCDDEYNFTDEYNLTQTFDGSLKLTFLGIPAGKYLITVDDRYRFYKEIISIQTVNESEVELKQWLYKDGDQCVHNTGGWMQCKSSGNNAPLLRANGSSAYSNASYSQSAVFLSNMIRISQNCTSSVVSDYNSGIKATQYGRTPVSCDTYIGTKKTLPLSTSLYKKMLLNATQNISLSLRHGSTNDQNTDLGTATVVFSGSGIDLSLATTEAQCYFVLGKSFSATGYGYMPSGGWYNGISITTNPGNVNYSYSSDITEIYLV